MFKGRVDQLVLLVVALVVRRVRGPIILLGETMWNHIGTL